jgi:uncharacterized protein
MSILATKEKAAPLAGRAIRLDPLWTFVLLACGISWLTWMPLVLAGANGTAGALRYLHLLGAWGPALAAMITAWLFGGRSELVGLLRLATRWRVSPRWHLVAWGSPFLLLAIGMAVLPVISDWSWGAPLLGRSVEYPELSWPLYWAASVVFYGFGEELGWRGYALRRLQRNRSALGATLWLSLIWAAWHLPLFRFAPGMSSMGIAEVLGWYFSILTGAVLFTWLLNSTESVLIAAVFHGTMDLVFLSPASPQLTNVLGALVTCWGIGVLHATKPATLSASGNKVVAAT